MKNRKTARRIDNREKVLKNTKEGRKGQHCLNLPDGVERWYPEKKGTYTFDVIPYMVTSDFHPDNVGEKGGYWERLRYWTHYIGRSVVCLKSVGARCPICEEIERLQKDYDDNADQIKAIKRKEQCMYNIILTDDKDQTIRVFDWSSFKFAEDFEKEISEGEERQAGYGNFPDGLTLKVRFSEEMFNGKPFLKASKFEFIERENEYEDSKLDETVDLGKALKVLSYDALKKLLTDMDDGDDTDSKPSKAKSKNVEEEENEDDDEGYEDDAEEEVDEDGVVADEEDEEEDDESVTKSPAKPKVKKPLVDDEDDLDIDDEDIDDVDGDEEEEDGGAIPTAAEIMEMKKDEIIDNVLVPNKKELSVDKTTTELRRMKQKELRIYAAGLVQGDDDEDEEEEDEDE